MTNRSPRTTIDGGKATLELRSDGIIHLAWIRSVRIEERDARARSVFSIPCAASRIALLGKSPVDRLLANFFLGVHTPPCPTRFFTSRDDATAWLLGPETAP